MQLDLFADAPVFYFRALEALGRLEPAACRALIEEHSRRFPLGPDPGPALEAAGWLEEAVPGTGDALDVFGGRTLAACRALREGRAAGFRAMGGDAGLAAAAALAARALRRAQEAGVELSMPVGEGLPWGVLYLWTGAPEQAHAALEGLLSRHEPSAAAYLALGDVRQWLGRLDAALVAYREGYLEDSAGAGWPVESSAVKGARRRYGADPEWGPAWWAVGAYLERFFPPFGKPSVEEVRRRWERFRALLAGPRDDDGVRARLFASGLLLAENTEAALAAGCADLVLVRRTLQEVNPSAWARLRETLGSEGGRRF
ncbi:MAG: hypothetical protein HZB55_14560 [Deltaproteobacteria bacterium]|nr:hypothetical protein [Deltaproteobacteria bacterium]